MRYAAIYTAKGEQVGQLDKTDLEILANLAEDEAEARERHNREGGDFAVGPIRELHRLAERLRA